MKILKLTLSATIDFVHPLGEPSQEEIDQILSREGHETLKAEAKKMLGDQAKTVGGEVLECDVIVKIVEV